VIALVSGPFRNLATTHLRACDRAVVGAILKDHISAVTSDSRVYLRAEAAGFRQAPFAAARPAAVVHRRGVDGLAHDRFRFDAGVESSEMKQLTWTRRRENRV